MQGLNRLPSCPYRGLLAFRLEDEPYFFGRDIFKQKLFQAVYFKSLVAVIGASGSGKSSVILAGLIPQLQQQQDTQWEIISFRPGNNPFESLAIALISVDKSLLNRSEKRLQEMELETYLYTQPHALHTYIDTLVKRFPPPYRILLFADQFEEIYTLCTDNEQRQKFLDGLLYAVNYSPAFTLVLTLRADFYNSGLSYRPFADALQDSTLNLGPMTLQELHEAIEKPAQKMQVQLEQGLTKLLVDEVLDFSGRLPLLEFALTQLWTKQSEGKLTYEGYKFIGGVEKAIANHAETVYTQLSEDERKQTEKIFIQLIQPGEGTEDTRRLSNRNEIGNWDLVTRLADARLVVTNRNDSTQTETVEIIHEALLRNWGRLQGWVQHNREFRTWQERFRVSLRQWEKSQDKGTLLRGKPLAEAQEYLKQRPEEISISEQAFIGRSSRYAKRQQVRERIIAGTISILALGALGLSFHIYQQARRWQIEGLLLQAEEYFESGEQLQGLIKATQAAKLLEFPSKTGDELSYTTKLKLQDLLLRIRKKNSFRKEGKSSPDDVQLSPDGKYLLVENEDNFDLVNSDSKVIETFKGREQVFSPDSQYIAFTDDYRKIILWKIDTKTKKEFSNPSNFSFGSLRFSPDSKLLASSVNYYPSDSIIFWTLDGQKVREIKGKEISYDFNFSPKGTLLYNPNYSSLEVFKLTGEKVNLPPLDFKDNFSFSFSADDKILAFSKSWGENLSVTLWNIDKQQKISTFEGRDPVFSPDGKLLAIQDERYNTIRLWELGNSNWKEKEDIFGYDPVFSSNGETIITSQNNFNVIGLYSSSLNLIDEFKAHSSYISTKFLSNDGKVLLSSDQIGIFKLWNLEEKKDLAKIEGENLAFSPDGKTVASVVDGVIKIWNLEGKEINAFKISSNPSINLTFSPDGKTLVGKIGDNQIKWWHLDGQEIGTFQVTGYPPFVFSPDGKMLAFENNEIVQLQTVEGQTLKTLKGDEPVFSPDGKILAYQPDYKTITLLNLENLETKTIEAFRLAFNPDGKTLAIVRRDGDSYSTQAVMITNLLGEKLYQLENNYSDWALLSFVENSNILIDKQRSEIILWNLDSRPANLIKIKDSYNNNIRFDPESQTLAYFEGETISLWDLKSNTRKILQGNSGNIQDIKFSPDGKLLASSSREGIIKLWSIDGQEMATLKAHKERGIHYISFSSDSKTLTSVDSNGRIIHWNLGIGQLVQKSCDWLRGYLQTSPLVSPQDKQVCDGVR